MDHRSLVNANRNGHVEFAINVCQDRSKCIITEQGTIGGWSAPSLPTGTTMDFDRLRGSPSWRPTRPASQDCAAVVRADGAQSMSLRHTGTIWGLAAADPPSRRPSAVCRTPVSLTNWRARQALNGQTGRASFTTQGPRHSLKLRMIGERACRAIAAYRRAPGAIFFSFTIPARWSTNNPSIRGTGATGDLDELMARFGASSVEVEAQL